MKAFGLQYLTLQLGKNSNRQNWSNGKKKKKSPSTFKEISENYHLLPE